MPVLQCTEQRHYFCRIDSVMPSRLLVLSTSHYLKPKLNLPLFSSVRCCLGVHTANTIFTLFVSFPLTALSTSHFHQFFLLCWFLLSFSHFFFFIPFFSFRLFFIILSCISLSLSSLLLSNELSTVCVSVSWALVQTMSPLFLLFLPLSWCLEPFYVAAIVGNSTAIVKLMRLLRLLLFW